VESKRPQSKFAEVVEEIRDIIIEDHLLPGDKLPSERELSERLAASRSSIREALRALELLGLIETKRGEGTFLRDFSNHQLIHLVGAFILQQDQTKRDVQHTKHIVEMGCLSTAMVQPNLEERLEELEAEIRKEHFTERDFFGFFMDVSGNQLLKKIWLIVSSYADAVQEEDRLVYNKGAFLRLIDAVRTKDVTNVFEAYGQLSVEES